MNLTRGCCLRKRCAIAAFLIFITSNLSAQESVELAIGKPDAIVDLRSGQGLAMMNAEWRVKEAKVVNKEFRSPGPGKNDPQFLYPTGKSIQTFDLEPKAGQRIFNDEEWERVAESALEERRGSGLLSFVWYRIELTIPPTVGKFATENSTAVFEIVADDYAEIFVDGVLNKTYGQAGGGVVKGWNARNRVVVGKNLKAGQVIQLAILVTNGPIADLPDNYVWLRSATIDFYHEFPVKNKTWQNLGEIVRISPELDEIVSPDAKLERLATGFEFTEGPVWSPDGFLLFSDPNTNVIYSYRQETGNVEIFRSKSGYSGINISEYHQPGSNGLTFDAQGRLTICQHGNRQVVRVEKKGPVTILAREYQGKRLNSPNDLTYRSDGILYFTDPPYGLPKAFDDVSKEISYSGVYAVIDGKTILVASDLRGPNGIAFSPDEKYLYISNWDVTDIHNTKIIRRYDVKADGQLMNGVTFFQMNFTDGDDALDGLKVDTKGNVYCAGPGGIWIISSDGKYLGRVVVPEHAANIAWGEDGYSLFITASSSIYKIRTKIKGIAPAISN
jgi:gluconolactonase